MSTLDPASRPSRVGTPWRIASDGFVTDDGLNDRIEVELPEGVSAGRASAVFGAVAAMKAVLPGMRAARSGAIINIGSEVTDLGNAEFGHYVAAKAAMHGLTRSWARELGPLGITVNTVEPGWIPVERHAGADTSEYRAGVLLGRMGTPADVAEAVAFLASPGARFITGQRLAVNGGKTMS